MRFKTMVSAAGLVVLVTHASRAALTPVTYAVTVDTSSISGLSGQIVFENDLPSYTPTEGTNTVAVTSLQPGGNGISESTLIGTETSTSHSAFTLTTTAASPVSEEAYNVTSFGKLMTFDVTLSGPDLLGDNPDSVGNASFALLVNANVPDPYSNSGYSFESVLIDGDPYSETLGITANGPDDLGIDQSTETTISQVVVPEPVVANLAAIGFIGALKRRRRA